MNFTDHQCWIYQADGSLMNPEPTQKGVCFEDVIVSIKIIFPAMAKVTQSKVVNPIQNPYFKAQTTVFEGKIGLYQWIVRTHIA